MTIPRIIHQIWWQGENNIPERYINFRKSWFKRHPLWKYHIWDKYKFESLLRRLNNNFFNKVYIKLPLMIQKIDFAKYIVLYYIGGCYVDMDTISEKSLDYLLEKYNSGLIVSQLNIYNFINFKLINNGVIFSKKKHKFFEYLFKEIYENKNQQWYQNSDWYVMDSTGPLAFSRAMLNYSNNVKYLDLIILDDSYLESCKMSDFGEIVQKGKYISHIHDCSWGSSSLKIHFIILKILKKYKITIYCLILLILYLLVVKKNI